MGEILRGTVGGSWTALTSSANVVTPPNTVDGNGVLGMRLKRRASRNTAQRWRAVAQVVHVLAQGEPNVAGRAGKPRETKVAIMVDPLEAKRLAAVEMQAIEARNKRKRQRAIEASNGGWAVLGLTAGICCEGYTGKSILIQIAGYLEGLADTLTQITPS